MKHEIDLAQFLELQKDLEDCDAYQFTVVTNSMMPIIEVGAQIMVVKPDFDALEKFDIIVFWDGKRLVCHYIWRVNAMLSPTNEKVYVTRGTNAPGADFPVASSKIFGLVVSHEIPWMLRIREYFRGSR